MTKATNHDNRTPAAGGRVYGARYLDTAGLPPKLLALRMRQALIAARDAEGLPPCSVTVAVRRGADEGPAHTRAWRVCVELRDLDMPALYREWEDPDTTRALLRRDVVAILSVFDWRNPTKLFDHRFRVYVHLTGWQQPTRACHLCGQPHPTSASDANGER
ncbi:hypothetical protein [Actinophytocola sp.]|uniref:hypothetical protein n=1 Tax=Actinophytocola sp. TaxID=1872138 RepID=UPI003D6A0681